jgi:hypothetical protein
MDTAPAPEAFGYTIFCDDIRFEIGNKITYTGVYSDKMLTHTGFPTVLPKLCFAVSYWQEGVKIVTPIKFVIFLPNDPDDKPSVEFGIADKTVEETLKKVEDRIAIENRGEKIGFAVFRTQISINNLVITEPGSMKVRAVRGEQLIRLGSLEIDAAPGTPTKAATS